jgi:hypothetical protein
MTMKGTELFSRRAVSVQSASAQTLCALSLCAAGPRWRNGAPLNLALYAASLNPAAAPNFIGFALAASMFRAANAAGIASPAGLSSSSTCFTLHNPAGSGKNLYIMEILCAVTAAPTANLGGIWLVANSTPSQAAPATTTNVSTTPNPVIEGATATPVAKAYSTATLAATPKVIRVLGGSIWYTSAANAQIFQLKDRVDGAVAVAPGCYVSIQAAAATTIQTSMTWVEM